MKKLLAAVLAGTLALSLLAGCGDAAPPAAAEPAAEATAPEETAAEEPVADEPAEAPYIAVVSKGFQHQFWQTVMQGAKDAEAEYGIRITFEGPPTESDIGIQVDMLNAALAQDPAAICLAALDTEAVMSQLNEAVEKGIPVIGFDSGVPEAPAGAIYSTASTNNYSAGKLAAQEMFKAPAFAEKFALAAEVPVTIAVQSQDAASASILGRTNGFLDGMFELAEGQFPGQVEVTGHDAFQKAAAETPVVTIVVAVPPTTGNDDSRAAAQAVLQNSANLIGYFCSNEASSGGLLSATNDGAGLAKDGGEYAELTVIGFDAGALTKNAVRNQYFYGAITQDPYSIGYLAVELAYKCISGESVDEIVDTGCKFYNAENMDNEDIAILLYD